LINKPSTKDTKISIYLIEIKQVYELGILERSIKNRPDLKDTDSWKTWRFGWSVCCSYINISHAGISHPLRKQSVKSSFPGSNFCFTSLFSVANFLYFLKIIIIL